MKEYDLIIVGAGVVGLSFANLLAQQTTLSILIFDAQKNHPIWEKDAMSARVSAINLASKDLLTKLDVWQEITERRASAFNEIAVWDALGQGEIRFKAEDIGEPELGFIIENNLLQSQLFQKIASHPLIEHQYGMHLRAIKTYTHAIELESEQATYRTRLLVAADGAQSWVRNQLGIANKIKSYQQQAIVATVTHELAHARIARQIFLSTGPLAFLPLNDVHISSIVWSLDDRNAQEIMAANEATFKRALGENFPYLGEIKEVGKRFAFDLHTHQSDRYIAARVALMGDAAHSVHPLAGLGINMGLADAKSLAQIVIAALSEEKDIGATPLLRRYERQRKADNLPLMFGIDWLQRLFTSDAKLLITLRSFGFNSVNKIRIIKNFFCRYAVGR